MQSISSRKLQNQKAANWLVSQLMGKFPMIHYFLLSNIIMVVKEQLKASTSGTQFLKLGIMLMNT
jgi:hypothetical protein